ncbi:MAG: methyltransferase domain-containing protein [Acidobacteria bacterium]|nr:methyltransferase domain-containing protein [Acidobacteriota bacterium]
MNHHTNAQSISEHYQRNDLAELILTALRAAGKNAEAPTVDDLAPVDQFHTGGKDSTRRLATRAALEAGMHVLDVGGGLGGPARMLANSFGCIVTVLDITPEYCRVGEMLTSLTGLSDRVSFRNASALDMPFAAESFDAVWTQHSSMNIEDKQRLYQEIHRVLRPGGRLALHEIMAGQSVVAPIHFPVPWARHSAISHLSQPEELRTRLAGMGFRELLWADETAMAVEWFQERTATAEPAQQHLGLHLLLGSDFNDMFRNQVRNLNENRIAIVQAVFERAQARK